MLNGALDNKQVLALALVGYDAGMVWYGMLLWWGMMVVLIICFALPPHGGDTLQFSGMVPSVISPSGQRAC